MAVAGCRCGRVLGPYACERTENCSTPPRVLTGKGIFEADCTDAIDCKPVCFEASDGGAAYYVAACVDPGSGGLWCSSSPVYDVRKRWPDAGICD